MSQPTQPRTGSDGQDPEVDRLVAALDHLVDGQAAAFALVSMGSRAIAPLRRFLLSGRISTVFQPRQWAVQALGVLNSRDTLIDYLLSPWPGDPQLHYAEEAVRNAAVLEFLRWPDPKTKSFLLFLSETTMLAGLAECFGRLRMVESIPFLARCLEDDVCRPKAEEALSAMGPAARGEMIKSAVGELSHAEEQPPSRLRRRRAALRVLLEVGLLPEDWPKLEPLLRQEDPEIVVRTCALAVKMGMDQAAPRGVQALISMAPVLPWFLQEELACCLLAWEKLSVPIVESEIQKRLQAPATVQIQDRALRALLRVLRLLRTDENTTRQDTGGHQCES